MTEGDATESVQRGPPAPWWAGPVALVIGVAVAGAVFIAYHGRGGFGDEGSFCTIAQGILGGRLPYRDLFNEKPPLQYFWTAAVMALGGPTLAGARIASSLTLALTVAGIALGALTRRAAWPVAAGLVLVTTAVAVGLEAYRNTAESTLALIFTVSAIVMARDGPRRVGAATLGGLIGLAIGFRQTAALAGLVLFASPKVRGARLSFLAGAMLVLAAWLVPLAAAGIFDDFLQATVLFHAHNPHADSYLRPVVDQKAGVAAWAILLLVAVAGSGRGLGGRAWMLVWLLAAAAPFFGRMDGFRLWPSAAAALTVLAWRAPAAPSEKPAKAPWRAGLLACAAIIAAAGAAHRFPARDSRAQAIVAALERVIRPGEAVWIGSFAPNLYCLSGLPPASRRYFILPWTDTAQVRGEILSDIARKRPVIVIDRSSPGYDEGRHFHDLAPVLARSYRVAPVALTGPMADGDVTIYLPIGGRP